jgi:predicted amidohydrolase
MTRIACAQLAPVVGDPAANRNLAARAIGAALDSGAQAIILPELMTTGYHLETSEAADLAEDTAGASLTAWVEALAGSHAIVVGGFCERGADGNIYNSAAMVSSDGLMSVYRKTHLWDQEPRLFRAGGELPPVVNTRWGKVGIAICYDLFFPEITRSLALSGAQLLALPTNSPFDGPRAPGATGPADGMGHIVARATAYLNRMYVAVCDRHGDERGQSWTARSSIIGPEGDFVAGPVAYEEQLLIADCDLADADRKQWDGTSNDAHADRRPELYAGRVGPVVPGAHRTSETQ